MRNFTEALPPPLRRHLTGSNRIDNSYHPRGAIMKLARAIFAVLLATAFAYTFTSSASAAGVNCSDFGSPQEAQDYFIANGGSPTNNVEGLDRDHDGYACEANAGNTSSGGGDVPVGNTGDVPSDTGSGTTDTTGDSGTATELPNTGSGPLQNDSGETAILIAISLMTLGAGAVTMRRRQA